MAHGWARSIVQFSVVRIALGASESMGTPSGIKTIASLFGADQRSTAFGISNGAANLGAIITPLTIPFVDLAIGWRGAFILVGALGLVWVAAWFLAAQRMHFAPAAASSPPSKLGYGDILQDRRTWGVAGAKALSDQVWWLLLFWTPDFFHRVFHLGVAETGLALAVVYSCAAVGSLFAGVVSTGLLHRGVSINTVRKGSMLVSALLVTPLPLALYVHNSWLAVGLLGLTLAAHQGFSVNVFSTITDIIPRGKVGSVTSFGALCGNLAGMGILFLAGELLNGGRGYLPLLLIAASSYLLALGWLQLLVPRLRLAEAEPPSMLPG
jgi:ACS family hexuronate transporter-like MFS transporter